MQLYSIDVVSTRQMRHDFRQNGRGGIGIRKIIQNHQKFIPAVTTNGISSAYTFRQLLRNMLDEHIADCMTERIVDGLEVVEIAKNQSDFGFLAISVFNCLLKSIP